MDLSAITSELSRFTASTNQAVGELRQENKDLTKALDALNGKLSAVEAGIGSGSDAPIPGGAGLQAEKKAVAGFMRNGGNSELAQFAPVATLQTSSQPDGGFSVLPEFDKSVITVARDASPIRRLAMVQTISGDAYEVLLDPSKPAVGWVEESEARPDTSTPQLVRVRIPVNELYANPKATQKLLDDSFIDIAAWLSDSVGRSMALEEGSKFVAGDGVKKPKGFLSYSAESAADFSRSNITVPQYLAVGSSTPTAGQVSDALIATTMTLRAAYRPNAAWLMNRNTAAAVRQLKDSTGAYLWAEPYGRIVEGQQATLLGYPVEISDDMPDIAGNATPIALADWRRAYCIVDRLGIRVLRDPYSAKPYTSFYTTKRVGGGMLDGCALKLVKWASS